MRRKSLATLTIGALAAALASLLVVQKPVEHKQVGDFTTGGMHRVVHVYDGDTVKLDNGERVRLIGIDTPESHDNAKLRRDVSKRRVDMQTQLDMGRQAAYFTRSLLADHQVRVEFDVEQRDRYKRMLAYLYLADGTFVNDKIIREGYAYPMTVPPNVRYADRFRAAFEEARNANRGLWSKER